MILESQPPRRTALLLLPVALVAAGLLMEARGTFPLLRFGIERTPDRTPSTLVVPADELQRGVSTVSLYVPADDLTGPDRGILTHKLEHGPDWERQGWVSFLEHGQLVHSSSVGVRIHGGSSRFNNGPQGFRLYFRRKYGLRELPAGVAFPAAHAHALRRLIIHNDVRVSRDKVAWHLINPLAYDIAAAVGGITAATRPVRFLLNGEFQGVFVLKEHFDPEDYFEPHFGHPVRLDGAEFDEVGRQIFAMPTLRMRNVGKILDLDNLTRWYIAVIFCATSDAYQGPGQFRDPTRASAQWFWVNWDMDQSFRNVERNSFAFLLSREGRRRARRPSDPRPKVMTTLLDEDSEYREYFMRVWTDTMNFVLTPAFLDERFRYYRDLGASLGLEDRQDLAGIERFLQQRPAIIRTYAEEWLKVPPSVRVAIVGDRGSVEVDGHRVRPGWEGYYFPGMKVTVRVPEDMAYALSHWRVNGQEVRGTSITLDTRDPIKIDIEPVWARGATLAPGT